ncbi:hypothetical protein Daus18300_012644 [Diaporthe australafricana]|uniref:Uncharacterized protein n=1 Tax=Diaporthe australafricana TaxID=127596 RepID=A0ABR3W243_9PEZI
MSQQTMKGKQATQNITDERKRSFGIGGAGNIRTKAEAIVSDVLPSEREQRRRSSVLSMVSSASSTRRTSASGSWRDMKDLFKTKSNKD